MTIFEIIKCHLFFLGRKVIKMSIGISVNVNSYKSFYYSFIHLGEFSIFYANTHFKVSDLEGFTRRRQLNNNLCCTTT